MGEAGRRKQGRLALVILFIVLLPCITRRLYASDEIEYFAFLRSVWFDHDFSFDNEYRYFDDHGVAARSGFHETFLESTSPTGLRKNFGTVGCAILWAPFYAAGDLTAHVLHATGRPIELDGYSAPYIAAVCYGSAVYGFLALLLSCAIARRVIGYPPYGAAAAVWIGTPLFFYMYVSPVFAHACSAFAVALFLWIWLIFRDRWSVAGMAAVGASAALVVMVREQDVFFLGGPAIDLLLIYVSTSYQRPDALARRFIAAAVGGVAAFVVYLPQLMAYVTINGRIGPSAHVANKMSWWSPHGLAVLLSPEHGLIFWTPLVVPALAGLVWLAAAPDASVARWRPDVRRIALCGLISVFLEIYVVGSVESWTVEGAFGQRRFISMTPLLVLGLAVLVSRAEAWPSIRRRLLWTALALCVWWNLGLAVAFGAHLMDRRRIALGDNLRTVFVVIPSEAPSLVWKYLTNRESFYNKARQ
jgi:hypothetical protein